jgi:hypothetical protein
MRLPQILRHQVEDEDESVEVTPAMIAAGDAALCAFSYDFWESRSPEDKAVFVAELFRAMTRAQAR